MPFNILRNKCLPTNKVYRFKRFHSQKSWIIGTTKVDPNETGNFELKILLFCTQREGKDHQEHGRIIVVKPVDNIIVELRFEPLEEFIQEEHFFGSLQSVETGSAF